MLPAVRAANVLRVVHVDGVWVFFAQVEAFFNGSGGDDGSIDREEFVQIMAAHKVSS